MTLDITRARQKLEERDALKSRQLEGLFRQAWDDFNAIVTLLIEKYHPRRIYQWGSLLDQRRFREYSDIDIAVEGITSAEVFFRMFGDAEALTRFPLDLIQIEKTDPLHAQSIREKGRIVYERED